jgi:hypothetical protein
VKSAKEVGRREERERERERDADLCHNRNKKSGSSSPSARRVKRMNASADPSGFLYGWLTSFDASNEKQSDSRSQAADSSGIALESSSFSAHETAGRKLRGGERAFRYPGA